MEVPVLNTEAEAVAVVVILVVEADKTKVVINTHGPPAVVAVLTLSER